MAVWDVKPYRRTRKDTVLEEGIYSFDSVTGEYRIGDGITAWEDLPVFRNLSPDDVDFYPEGGALKTDHELVSSDIIKANDGGTEETAIGAVGPGGQSGITFHNGEFELYRRVTNILRLTAALEVLDEIYDATNWDGSVEVPTKNAVRDKIESITTAYAPLASPAFTGTPTAPTAAPGTNTTQIATTAFIKAAIDALINSAPGTLDTLGEIATQLASDESVAAALATTVAGKLAIASNLSDLANVSTALTNLGFSAFIKTLIDDADAATALATLGAQASATALTRAPRVVAMTDGATITPNADTTDIGTVTIAGNRTMNAPSGSPSSGQQLILRIAQDGTGSRLITWDAAYHFGADVVSPTLSISAGAVDYVMFRYRASLTAWDCVAVARGY